MIDAAKLPLPCPIGKENGANNSLWGKREPIGSNEKPSGANGNALADSLVVHPRHGDGAGGMMQVQHIALGIA